MGLPLPGELAEPLRWTRLGWPEPDESALQAAAQSWTEAAATLRQLAGRTDRAAALVWSEHRGATPEAFRRWWTRDVGPAAAVRADADAADLIGTALTVSAGAVLAAKTAYVAHLVELQLGVSSALATARVTFGASTAGITDLVRTARARCLAASTAADAVIEGRVPELLRRAEVLMRAQ